MDRRRTLAASRTKAEAAHPAGANCRSACGWLALLLAGLVLAACSSVSMGYRGAPTLAGWWIDRQLDLPAAHREALDRALDETHRWHAGAPRQALAAILRDAAQRLERPVNEADLREVIAALEAHADEVSTHFANALLPRLPALDAQELARIDARLAERQRDYAEKRLGKDEKAQQQRRRERTEEAAEDWFGTVSAVQRALVARSIESGAFDDRVWVAERARRQQALVDALRGGLNKVGGTQQAGALQRWFSDWRRDRSAAVSAAIAAQRQASIVLWLDMIDAATPAQRQHLRERLLGWADDLDRAARAVLLAEAKG